MLKTAVRVFHGAGLLGLSPLLISAATLISVPVLLRVLGEQPWLSIAVGQAVGELCRVIVVWGWNSIGLARVARMDEGERLTYYFESLVPRFLLVFPVAGLAAVVLFFVIPLEDPLAAWLPACASALYGLNAAWVLIGGREPMKLLLFDAVPRSASILLGTLAVSMLHVASSYGAVTAIGSFAAVAIPLCAMLLRARSRGIAVTLGAWRNSLSLLREGLPVVAAGLITVGRLSFAVVVSPIAGAAAAPAVALGDKFLRWANTAMTPVLQSLQVRIPRGDSHIIDRARRGVLSAWLIGVPIGLAVGIVVPIASELISGGEIVLGLDIAIPVGIQTTLIFVASITGNSVLVLLGRLKSVLSGSALSLIVLGILFLPLYTAFGAAGAFWALVSSEAVVTTYQFVAMRRAIGRLQRSGNSSSIQDQQKAGRV